MRETRAIWLAVILTGLGLQPLSALSASVPNFKPDPVGETIYRTQLSRRVLLPVALIGGSLLAAWAAHKTHHRDPVPHL